MEFDEKQYISNISYIDKDFRSLWQEILETVPKLTTQWNPSETNESDPLYVLLQEMAILSDKLNYNIDKNILELFPATLTQEKSAYNVYASLGYSPDWYVSATTTLTLSYNGMVGTEVLDRALFNNGSFTIPKFTAFSDDDSEVIFTSMEDIVIPIGEVNRFTFDAMEGTMEDFKVNGSTQILYENLDSQNRLFLSNQNVAQNGIIISNYSDFSDYAYDDGTIYSVDKDGYTLSIENGDELYDVWTRVDNLNQYTSGNKIYRLGIDAASGQVFLQFPGDIGDLIGDGIYIKYLVSSGAQGNVSKGSITKFRNSFEMAITDYNGEEYYITESDISVVNTKSTQNGKDPLTIEEMKQHFDRIVGVFNTLVTLRDYENYIYEYSDTSGSNVVSNIRVSDRFSDLEDSLTYKTMSASSVISDAAMTIQESGTATMTPYDLRLYPLTPVSPVEDRDSFDLTFNLINDVNGEKTFIDRNNDLVNLSVAVQNAIKRSKCISHDFLDSGYPILVPFDLTGQIYLKTNVSSVDAIEISNNIEEAVYEAFNSRKLDWGKAINIEDVNSVIRASDNRISYAGLDPIVYEDPISDYDDHGYNVTVRSILNGSKAWTTYQPYLFDYGMNFQNSSFLDNITSINTSVLMGNSDEADTYVVNDNETFTVLIPSYRTVTTYGNYLYMIAKENGMSSENPTVIKAGVPTTLNENQHIYMFNTRDDATAALNEENIYTAPYVLKPGTIVKTSMTVEFTSDPLPEDIMILESADSISVLERAEGTLNASNVYTGGSTTEEIYISTTSQPLHDAFENGKEYTLLSEEYFFYTDAFGSELGILGEGTTLVPPTDNDGNPIGIDVYLVQSEVSIGSLLNGRVNNTSYLDWTTIESGKIGYELNDLKAFGANYVINITSSDATGFHPFENYAPNEFFDIGGTDTTIRYQLVTPVENDDGTFTYSVDDNDWTEMDQLMAGEGYKVLVRLMLVTGPGVEQELVKFTADNLIVETTNATALSPAYTSQQVDVVCDGETTILPYTTSAGVVLDTIQASEVIMSEGGVPLTFFEDDEVCIFYYAKGTGNAYVNGFVAPEEGKSYVAPGDSSQYCIIPYTTLDDQKTVLYYVARGGAEISTTNIAYLGRPYVVASGAQYYTGSAYSAVSGLTSSYTTLTTSQLYVDGFCPLYVPADNEAIEDPEAGKSYFLSQHPLNRYALPYMRSLDSLTISSDKIY